MTESIENNDYYSEEALQERLTKVYLKENSLSADMEPLLKAIPFAEREAAAQKYKLEQDKQQQQQVQKTEEQRWSGINNAKEMNERDNSKPVVDFWS